MPTVSVNFVDDLCNAAMGVLVDNYLHFGTAIGVGTITSDPKIEYARDGNAAYYEGNNGTCRVYPLETPQADSAYIYPGSKRTDFVLEIVFDLIETKTKDKAKARVMTALENSFSDRGVQFFAELTDSGSNLPVKSGLVVMGQTTESPGARGPSNIKLTTTLSVTLWHKMPLTYEVTTP